MSTLKRLIAELLWLGGAGVCAWFFPKTVLVIVGLGAVVTIALWRAEKSFV
ncbi:MAG: hypothetical protein HY234_07625 [Acidobacteria bacterium]|nr:hypothetical protein [Acidobacteriota bacterium]MBI3662902.1 hypothetical protein [Acidobacteriota bacterium]